MKTLLIATFALMGAVVPAGGVQPQANDPITSGLAEMVKSFRADSYEPTGWEIRDTLNAQMEWNDSVTLAGGGIKFRIAGVCDDCEDMYIRVFDSDGKQVDKFGGKGNFVLADVFKPGKYRVQVMIDCKTENSCPFGAMAFVSTEPHA